MTWEEITSIVNDIAAIFQNTATNDAYHGQRTYDECRDILMNLYHNTSDQGFKDAFPSLIAEYESLEHFWQFIKYEFGTYAERRKFLYEVFNPLRKYLDSKKYKKSGLTIKVEISISNAYIFDAIGKANKRIEYGDYDGAITTARTLLEEMQTEIYKKLTGNAPAHKGDLVKLYNMVAPLLNLSIDKDLDDRLKQILSGLYSINNGISNMRNVVGDAHAKRFKPEAHHARLAVNCAFTFCQFLCDTYLYQKKD